MFPMNYFFKKIACEKMLTIFRQKFTINKFTQIDNRKSYIIGDSKGLKSSLSELSYFTDREIKK